MKEMILLGITILGMILLFVIGVNTKPETSENRLLSFSTDTEAELIVVDEGFAGDIII